MPRDPGAFADGTRWKPEGTREKGSLATLDGGRTSAATDRSFAHPALPPRAMPPPCDEVRVNVDDLRVSEKPDFLLPPDAALPTDGTRARPTAAPDADAARSNVTEPPEGARLKPSEGARMIPTCPPPVPSASILPSAHSSSTASQFSFVQHSRRRCCS